MKKVAVLSTVAAFSFATAAVADGAADWQGFYLGAGINSNSAEYTVTPTFDGSNMNISFIGGYNHAIGANWVIGAEVNLSAGELVDAGFPGQPSLSDAMSFRLRAGYAMDDFMFYLGAGSLQADLAIPVPVFGIDGTQAFIGAEMRVTDRMTTRIEYSTTSMDTPVYGPGQSVDVSGMTLGILFGF
jgi:outer membrane immunogenic protein